MSETIIHGAEKLAPFNPSSPEVINCFLELSNLKSSDVVFDLGCGDGRVLVEAAKRVGCRCVGVEYDSAFVDKGREILEAEDLGVRDLVQIIHGDACKVDFSEATVVFVYLNVKTNVAFNERMQAAFDRGVRIVSNMFSLSFLGDPCQITRYNNGLLKLSLYDKQRAPPSDA